MGVGSKGRDRNSVLVKMVDSGLLEDHRSSGLVKQVGIES